MSTWSSLWFVKIPNSSLVGTCRSPAEERRHHNKAWHRSQEAAAHTTINRPASEEEHGGGARLHNQSPLNVLEHSPPPSLQHGFTYVREALKRKIRWQVIWRKVNHCQRKSFVELISGESNSCTSLLTACFETLPGGSVTSPSGFLRVGAWSTSIHMRSFWIQFFRLVASDWFWRFSLFHEIQVLN